jgi:hypothetical protein
MLLVGGCGTPASTAATIAATTYPAPDCEGQGMFAIWGMGNTFRGFTRPDGGYVIGGFSAGGGNPWKVPGGKYTGANYQGGTTVPYVPKDPYWNGRTIYIGLSPNGQDIAWWAADATCDEIDNFAPPPSATSGRMCMHPMMAQEPAEPPAGSSGDGNCWDGPCIPVKACIKKDVTNYAKASCGAAAGVVTGATVCCTPIDCDSTTRTGWISDGCGGRIYCEHEPPPPPPHCHGNCV